MYVLYAICRLTLIRRELAQVAELAQALEFAESDQFPHYSDFEWKYENQRK